jgi:hypothetical protein
MECGLAFLVGGVPSPRGLTHSHPHTRGVGHRAHIEADQKELAPDIPLRVGGSLRFNLGACLPVKPRITPA